MNSLVCRQNDDKFLKECWLVLSSFFPSVPPLTLPRTLFRWGLLWWPVEIIKLPCLFAPVAPFSSFLCFGRVAKMTKCLGNAFSPGRTYTARRYLSSWLMTLPFDLLCIRSTVPAPCSSAYLNPAVYWVLDNEFLYRAILFYSERIIHKFHNN